MGMIARILPKFRWFQSRPKTAWCCRWVLGSAASAIVLLWVVGLFVEISWWVPRGFRAMCGPGAICIFDDPMLPRGVSMMEFGPPHAPGVQIRRSTGSASRSLWVSLQRLPSVETMGTYVDNVPMVAVVVPFWIPLLLTAPLALAAWRNRWVVKREVGRCPTCSYSRTGLAPSAPCPECGQHPIART